MRMLWPLIFAYALITSLMGFWVRLDSRIMDKVPEGAIARSPFFVPGITLLLMLAIWAFYKMMTEKQGE